MSDMEGITRLEQQDWESEEVEKGPMALPKKKEPVAVRRAVTTSPRSAGETCGAAWPASPEPAMSAGILHDTTDVRNRDVRV